MIRSKLLIAAAAAAPMLLASGIASASTYSFSVREANQGGTQFNADPAGTGFNFAGAISATFDYTGALSFNDTGAQNSNSSGDLNSAFFTDSANISNYVGSGTLTAPANANFNTLANFLGSSGSASGFQYGQLYTIDLGTLMAGTQITVTHDDGASVFQGSSEVGSMTSSPTTAVTQTVTLASAGDTTLYYARENGSPSVLDVTINPNQGGVPPAVPEPTSLALLASGLLGLGFLARRRSRVG